MIQRDVAPLSAALEFAEGGYPVLPLHGIVGGQCTCGNTNCRSPGKHPHPKLAPRGKDDATTNGGVIESWFSRYPELNYGITTDKLVVIDIDPRNSGDEAWLELIRKHHDVHTWRVVTGGGGQHILFDAGSSPLPCGKLARGVDVKGRGGYIVGVGSSHISGKRYHWFPDCDAHDTDLVPVPKWIRDRLTNPQRESGLGRTPKPPEHYRGLVEPALEGERNNKVAALFGHLFGTPSPNWGVLYELVRCWNRINCVPPLDDDEVLAIARSIAGCEHRKRGCA